MTPGRAALIGLMDRYLLALLDPFVSLLEVHKLMYLLQEAGEPLNLRFRKGPYGPYAENLRHVLNAVEGHFISGYADGGDSPNKMLELIPGAVAEAFIFLQQHPETLGRFDEVSKIVEGFESAFGLELLSTVYWVMKNEPVNSLTGVINYTYAWNKHKRQFTQRQIAIAADVVESKGWLGKTEIEASV